MLEAYTALMTFGRFQPCTKAHGFLFQKIFRLACDLDINWQYVFISPTQDNKKNPLSQEERCRFMSTVYPYMTFVVNPEIKHPFDAVCELGKVGFNKVIIVCGNDRVKNYESFSKYINHPDESKCIPYVTKIEVIGIGDRDPDSDDEIESLSATNARKAAVEGNFERFKQIVPRTYHDDIVTLYNSVRTGITK